MPGLEIMNLSERGVRNNARLHDIIIESLGIVICSLNMEVMKLDNGAMKGTMEEVLIEDNLNATDGGGKNG